MLLKIVAMALVMAFAYSASPAQSEPKPLTAHVNDLFVHEIKQIQMSINVLELMPARRAAGEGHAGFCRQLGEVLGRADSLGALCGAIWPDGTRRPHFYSELKDPTKNLNAITKVICAGMVGKPCSEDEMVAVLKDLQRMGDLYAHASAELREFLRGF